MGSATHTRYNVARSLCLRVAFLILLLSPVSAAAQTAWNQADWTLYDTITIDAAQIDDDLTDFPVYVDLSDLSSQFWGTTPSASNTVATDIRVTTNDFSPTELPRELVAASSTTETGELHFKADSISSTTDTVFRIYYNGTTTGDYATTSTYGAQNVWTNDYVGVWHMEESPTGVIFDSVGNGLNATSSGSMTSTDNVSGQLGGNAINFDAIDDLLIVNSDPLLEGLATISYSAWFNSIDPEGAGSRVISKGDGTSGDDYHLSHDALDAMRCRVTTSGTVNRNTAVDVATTTWEFGFCNYDGVNISAFIDDVAPVTAAQTGVIADNNQPLTFGGHNDSPAARGFEGSIDEVRIASTSRSSAWISAEYTNQSTTTDFYTAENGSRIVITGTLYENDGVTPITRTATITAAVGTSTPSLHSALTNADGSFSISGIATSTIGDWATSSDIGNTLMYGIEYGAGLFVAVGDCAFTSTECIVTSEDGVVWSTTTQNNSNSVYDWYEDVAYGNGVFVAVGDCVSFGANCAAYSVDGTSWQEITPAGNNDFWKSVTYGDGRFVAVGQTDDRVMYSDDGINWSTTVAAGDNDSWTGVTYGDGLFVAVGSSGDRVMYSSDGVSWSTTTAAGDNDIWYDVTYGDGRFVAVSDCNPSGDCVMYSDDGINWTANAGDGNDDHWYGVTYANGLYVAVGITGDRVMYSTDSITWVAQSAAGDDDVWRGVAYGNGAYVAISYSGDDSMYTDAGFGEDTPITLYVDESATTSSSTANTLTYGVNNNSGTTTITADLRADTVWLHKPTVGSSSNEIYLSDADFYDAYDNSEYANLLFTATTSTTTINADLYIDAATDVYAPQNLIVDGDFDNQGTFYAERGEVHADATTYDVSRLRHFYNRGNLSDTSVGQSFTFSGDGFKLYAAQSGGSEIDEYTLSTAFDISDASYENATTVPQVTDVRGMKISPDGSKLILTTNEDEDTYEYNFGIAHDITTLSYVQSTSTGDQVSQSRSLEISRDGTKLYVGNGGGTIYEYTLGTAWDVSTAQYEGSGSVVGGSGLGVDDSGTLLIDLSSDAVHYYSFGTPYDVSSLTHLGTTSHGLQDIATETDIDFNANGSQLTILGWNDWDQYYLDDEQFFTGNFSATSSLWDLTVGDTATVSPAATTEVDSDYHVGGSAAGPYAGLVELTSTSTLSGTGNFGFVEVQGTASSTNASTTFTDLTVASGANFTASTSLTITGDFDNYGSTTIPRTNTTYFGGQGTYGSTNFEYAYTASTLSGNVTQNQYIAFSPDGTKFYVGDSSAEDTSEFTLSTPWDLETASYVHATSVYGRGLEFSIDGTRMYVGSSTNAITEYSLSTPWDISSSAFRASTSISANTANIRRMAIDSSGTRLYVVDLTSDAIDQYEFGTPWDITTLSYVNTGSVVSEEGNPVGLDVSPDGTSLLLVGNGGADHDIHAYNLTTPWDITTLSHAGDYDQSALSGSSPVSVKYSSDGSKVYSVRVSTHVLHQYDVIQQIGTSTDVTTERFQDVEFSAGGRGEFTGPFEARDLTIGSNATVTAPAGTLTLDGDFDLQGTFLNNGGTVVADAVITDIEDAKFDVSVPAQDFTPTDIYFDQSGTRMYGTGGASNEVNHWTLTVPFDVSSATFVVATTTLETPSVGAVALSADGTKMYLTGDSEIDQYTLSTPWDITTSSYVHSTSTPNSTDVGMVLNDDGTKLFLANGGGTKTVVEYSLSTPWDISTAALVYELNVNSQVDLPSSLSFTRDGTSFVVPDAIYTVLHKYTLSTPWDLASASYTNDTFYIGQQTFGVALSASGDKLFLPNGNDDTYDQYGLDSIQYFTGAFTSSSTLNNFTVGNTATVSAAYDMEIEGDLVNNGSLAGPYSGLVTLSGTSNTIAGEGNHGFVNIEGTITTPSTDITYTDLTISSTGDYTAPAGTMTVTGDLDVEEGTFDANSGSTTLKGQGTYNTYLTYETATTVSEIGGINDLGEAAFNSDGTIMYLTRSNGSVGTNQILQYSLSTPWDVSTASYVQASTTSDYNWGLHFSPDGVYMYTQRLTDVEQYILSTPWDISTAAYVRATSTNSNGGHVTLSKDGSKLLVIDGSGGDFTFYDLSTPWDLSTAAFSGEIGAGSPTGGGAISADGTTIFAVDINPGILYEYRLDVPWDSTGATYVRSFDISSEEATDPNGAVLSSNGEKLYLVGKDSDTIHQYSIASQIATTTGSNAPHHLEFDSGPTTFTGPASTTGTFTLNNSGATTTFNASSTYTFAGIDWQGASSTNELILRSSATGTEWNLVVPSQATVEFVNVEDSNASSGAAIIAASSTDSGNNTNWYFNGDMPAVPGIVWNSTDWTLYDTITIRHENIDEPLRDFPVYVDLADLSAQFWSTTVDGGTDIRITTDEASPTELPREVVSASTTLETGELHFKADYISEVIDTSFRIYYNGTTTDDYATDATYGAENVWTNDYVGVWHMDDDPSSDGTLFDSTSNSFDGTASGTMAAGDVTSSQLGEGIDFDGTDDMVEFAASTSVANNFTISAWAQSDQVHEIDSESTSGISGVFNQHYVYFPSQEGSSAAGAGFSYGTNGVSVYEHGDDYFPGLLVASNTAPGANWNYVNVAYTNKQPTLYLNGELERIGLTSLEAEVRAFGHGSSIGGGVYGDFDGQIDEVRIASTSRSAAWIKAEYINQSTTTLFYSLDSGTGSTTLANHTAGQVNNTFNFQNKTNEALFAFNLTPNSGNATVTRTKITLSGAQDISVSNFTNINLYEDVNDDGAYDGGDTQLSTGVMTPDGQHGDITFETDFLINTITNYIVVADITAPDRGSQLTFDLYTSGITMMDDDGGVTVSGSVSSIQHHRLASKGGGGRSANVGSDAPEGDGDVGGGTNEGGELIGSDPDFYWPTNVDQLGQWSNPTNAFDQTDGTYASETTAGHSHEFTEYAHNVPGSDTVEGIEVKLEVSGTTAAGDIGVELSWDGGTSWTATGYDTGTLTTTDRVVVIGGPSDKWGRTWTASELSNSNFGLRVTGNPSSNTVQIDEIQVKVYHQASGGGSGGGGAI